MDTLRSQYSLKALLEATQLPRATFYDRLHRNHKPDKYADLKAFISKSFQDSHEIYGYRRIYKLAQKAHYKVSPNTVLRLMGMLGLAVTIYSRHTSGYHSYKGHVGTVNDNLLHQQFNATKPNTVFHTDVTQVKLLNHSWGYISAIIDEASREVVTVIVSSHANKAQLRLTIDDFALKYSSDAMSIMHSDQGWQYQTMEYQTAMRKLGVVPSMSRKGNCHDNAPIESFFSLMKRECLYRHIIHSLDELRELVTNYVSWYNTKRISLNKNGLTPVEYREQAIA
ncbi:IS3 family transposase [Lacticaseibacillus zhaodongensis]|uniref:IS3 family transposase n=1 Tax=Lacticaseibacillus zhaodongensis TaxID=2668065 RepID=UPI0018AFF071|nr:IS3 family transposase [Lacticaseibacillus zhaodongensis]